MKNNKKIIVLFFLLGSLYSVFSQQDSQFTQYMYNTSVINPGHAGTRNVLSLNTTYRSQWQGINGAPKTQSITIHTPLTDRVGGGITYYRDEIGPSLATAFAIDLSYNLVLNENELNFTFGMKGGFQNYNVDYSRLNIEDPTDIPFQNSLDKFSPIIGIGGYLYTNKWYIGLSSPNLFSFNQYEAKNKPSVVEEPHYYLTGGYVFDINEEIKFKPAMLVKVVSGAPLAIDFSANFLINKHFTLGASYRYDSAISALLAFQLSSALMLGYAYDYDITDIGEYSNGSHEFFMRYEFLKKVNKKVSPRFF